MVLYSAGVLYYLVVSFPLTKTLSVISFVSLLDVNIGLSG